MKIMKREFTIPEREEAAARLASVTSERAENLSVSALQIRRAIRSANLITKARTAVEALTESEKEFWEYATEVKMNDPVIQKMATSMGLNRTQLGELFKTARKS